MKNSLLKCLFLAFLCTPASAAWVAANGGQTPQEAIVAGKDSIGRLFYICRVLISEGVYPGQLRSGSMECTVTYNNKIYSSTEYEVLVGNGYSWAVNYNGGVPFDALPAGRDQNRKTLYICRGEIDSIHYAGSIQSEYKACSVPYEGMEKKVYWYEVLVSN